MKYITVYLLCFMPMFSMAQKAPIQNDSVLMENDSSMLFTYVQRAQQRIEGGYFKGALDDYNAALKLYQTDAQLWLARAMVKEKLRDLKGASEDYGIAIQLDSTSEKSRLLRGNLFTKMGRYHEALLDYNKALVLNSSDAVAYYQRSIVRQKLRQNQEACEDARKAESLGMVVDAKFIAALCSPRK